MNDSLVRSKKQGLIIGTQDGVEDSILADLTLQGFDIHQAEEFGSVVHLLESNDYNFILFLDKAADGNGPEFLRSIIPLVPGRKVIVLLNGKGMGRYVNDIPKNVLGFMM